VTEARHDYSPFLLDLYYVSDEPRDPELSRHLDGCVRCRAYIEHLDAASARPFALPVARRRWWPVAALAFAALAVAALALWLRAGDRPPYIATKGEPGVQLLVRRADQTVVWDASRPVRAGDAIALRLACQAMTRATVLFADHFQWKRAFGDACRDGVLPFTLVVDGEPGDERIAIVLSNEPLDDMAAQHAIETQARSAAVWTLQLVLTKEMSP
jgi:hypothetical protein